MQHNGHFLHQFTLLCFQHKKQSNAANVIIAAALDEEESQEWHLIAISQLATAVYMPDIELI